MNTFDGITTMQSNTAASGTLTLADIQAALDSLRDHARPEPNYFFVSPKMRRELLILERISDFMDFQSFLYTFEIEAIHARHPASPRKLRKCIARTRTTQIARERRAVKQRQQRTLAAAKLAIRTEIEAMYP